MPFFDHMEDESLRSPSDVKTTMMYIYALNRDLVGVEFIKGSGVKLIRIRCRDQPLDWEYTIECKGVTRPSARNPRACCTERNQSSASYADQSNYC